MNAFEAVDSHRGGQLTRMAKALRTALLAQQRRVTFVNDEQHGRDHGDNGGQDDAYSDGMTMIAPWLQAHQMPKRRY